VLVERPGDLASRLGDLADVGAALTVDQDAQHASGQLEVVELEAGSVEDRGDQGQHAVCGAHGAPHLLPDVATAWAEAHAVPNQRNDRSGPGLYTRTWENTDPETGRD
jgi:hypothetical protein